VQVSNPFDGDESDFNTDGFSPAPTALRARAHESEKPGSYALR
jgi:hypothetical protein